MGKLIFSMQLSSRENATITDVPDSEQVEQGTVVLGMWFDDYTYVRYEALRRLYNASTLYYKTQMIGQKFNRGLGLISFETEITSTINDTGSNYQVQQIYGETQSQSTGFQQMYHTDQTISPEIKRDENNLNVFNENNMEQTDGDFDVKAKGSVEKGAKTEEGGKIRNNEEYDDYEDEEQKGNEEEDKAIKNALMNAAVTYSVININKLKKEKLHKITSTHRLINSKNTKWTVKSPCSGILTTNLLEDEPGQKIEQGTLFATIKCDKTQRGSKDRNYEDLIVPFSVKVTNIKIKFQESKSNNDFNTDTSTLHARVSKNERILSGKLVNESKYIPNYLIYGNYQLITAPCRGRISIYKDIGSSVKGREKVFKVRCKTRNDDSYNENNMSYGKAVKSGLVAHYFKDDHSNVKVSYYEKLNNINVS
ncbi:hypothetical protein FG386_000154 [Cryptosporidium ryanae]|uniref:uncharacterized protein n=1 Tax=Cryptosporidium ryanae TaxID=515981 RepID=UPI003519E4F5|nr:hypothetical protein FG386_000154 [Cryptosporidium ryanae]